MKNILLVFGGKSYEHDISVVTAMQIYQKVKTDGFKLHLLYVSRENKLFLYESKSVNQSDFAVHKFSEKNKSFKQVEFVFGEKKKLFARSVLGLKEYLIIDAAIFACHGGNGENGWLVSLFKQMDIPVSCGSVEGLGICMNKFLFKQTMKGLKVPVVKGFKIEKREIKDKSKKEKIELKLRLLKFPVVIKANGGGSSIGVFVAKNMEEFNYMLCQAFDFDNVVLVEKFIDNAREFNIAVLGDGDVCQVSEIDEPLKKEELLTFADKYLSGAKTKGAKTGSMENLRKRITTGVPIEVFSKMKDYALKIFKGLNLYGVVRIDFLYSEKLKKVYVCEANAIPGSLAYYFFNQGHVVINEFVERLIEIAEKNHLNEQMFKSDFVTDILK